MISGQGSSRLTAVRRDVQALRGIAVLMVVVFHSGLGWADAGYLGVDMFFVISGFLITGVVARGIEGGDFSFARFYARRVRRLLPAAYTVLILTTVASMVLLTSIQYSTFFVNLVGSVFFVANITLWSQIGYFASESAYQPLLHMWSLAIEEQYYLLLPLAMRLCPPRFWLPALIAIIVLGLGGGLYLATIKPSVAFFWLPTRAWELGVGSVSALTWTSPLVRRNARRLLLPAIAVVLLVPLIQIPGPTPGFGALAICFATAVVILAKDMRAETAGWLAPLTWIGDRSYSLYLVHWPMFALARAARLTPDLSVVQSIGLIVTSLILAALLYGWIENPVRRSGWSGKRLVAGALASSMLVLGLAWVGGQGRSTESDKRILAPLEGLELPGCFTENGLQYQGKCTQSPQPRMLVWGDSYSSHLMPGLVATTPVSLAQASRGHCGPFANFSAVVTLNERPVSEGCLYFNRSVLDYISRTPSIEVVILSGQYFRSLPSVSKYAIKADRNLIRRSALGLYATINAQKETVDALHALGKRVVIVSPPPPSSFDMGQCWLRKEQRLPTFGPHRACLLSTIDPARNEQQYERMMRGFERRAGSPVIWLDDALCVRGWCMIESAGQPIFRDTGHLTKAGSLFIGRRLNLGRRAWHDAR